MAAALLVILAGAVVIIWTPLALRLPWGRLGLAIFPLAILAVAWVAAILLLWLDFAGWRSTYIYP